MSSVESVDIELEHDIDEQYQYQPGEIIRGKIVIHLVRNTLIQSILLTIKGEGVCSWDDIYNGTQVSNENYIDASQTVYTSKDVSYLDTGYHRLPFEYQLPDNIPSSFIGKFGSVTYILKAIVQGERNSQPSIATEPFLVARKFILPDDMSQPQSFEESKTFFAMCSWGKLTINMQLSKMGYVPGEDICLQAEVKNRSPLRVTAIQGSLIMNSSYLAQKQRQLFKQIVNKRRDDFELEEGEDRRWQHVRIGVPPYIPESALACCDIIDLSYVFQFRVELMGGKELKIEVPIIIGSNPKGLEIPADYEKDVNIHWTRGRQDVTQDSMKEQQELKDKWIVESPEFRKTDTQVMNPLFVGENNHMGNGESSPTRKKSGHHDFDDIRDFTKM
ncbi:arrestin domain-containing protein 4-like [Mya arenaria]|uniref:arrestin domain-containing protein 4-like n=1 Tax=Mya arenaria TaxID=6604 RepID=UPI0022E3696B|nr:arrestin domain-containing protein 4-like [Mya arenaria]XP_052789811.1 arrestin domain-containing protein 4-like [Mya arenaria]